MAEPAVPASAAAFDAAVLIVAYRSRAHQARLAAALDAQTVPPREILILENGSPEGERLDPGALPRGARLIESDENLGFAGGNNRLAREAGAEWLLLLNPDAFPDPDWIAQLQAATARHPGVSLFGCTQRADGAPGVLDGAGDVYHFTGLPYRGGYGLAMDPPAEGEVFAACGAALLIRRTLFERLGGFDEDYFCYVEDVDLGFRARLSGERVVQVRDAAVSHVGYASSGRTSDFAVYHGVRNRLWTFFKDTPGWLFALLLPVHVAATALLWVRASGSGTQAAFGRAVRDGIRGLPAILRKRAAVQRARTVSAWRIARAMTWSPGRLRRRAPDVRPLQD